MIVHKSAHQTSLNIKKSNIIIIKYKELNTFRLLV